MPRFALIRWFADIGRDPTLAIAQACNMRGKVPLLYGLLLINSIALALTHYDVAPRPLTLIVPPMLFVATVIRMMIWVRAARLPPPSHADARRQLLHVTIVAGPLGVAYLGWAMLLLPYGDPSMQAHVALYIATTVIGVIFCLTELPQAALVVTVAVMPAFIAMCLRTQEMMFVTFAINVGLVLAVLLRVLFNSFQHFRDQVAARAVLGLQHDELRRLNDENRALALTDSLTGLPNRRQFYADLDSMTADDDVAAFALGVLDLDRFKPVNDTYGHQIGDRLLEELARRLRAIVQPAVTVYRLGGDEFGLLGRTGGDGFVAMCERVVQALDAPFAIGELHIAVGGSLGVALYPDAGLTAGDLFDRADYALYHAKRNDGGGVCMFTPSLETAIRADRAIEAALKASSFDDELHVYLQPIVDIATGCVGTVEVLARWTSPLVGDVAPSDFIAIAERSTVIHSITLTVLRKGLAVARRLPDDMAVSFNISACDLNSDTTIAGILREIERSGIDPARIWVEVTETAVMRNADTASEALGRLRALGVKVALDDFGTGYSSLSNLHRLPLDKVKIDRSFMAGLEDRHSRSIIQAVLTLCRTMGADCVVEGVETVEQLEFLRTSQCRHAQGYLFARPMPAATFIERVRHDGTGWSIAA